ncbi:MAG TPA: TonB family protein [Pyrinomonadaceae bacterium]|nr:TonB family protein [Pyrinomonadaceae bacterium]
MKLKFLSLVSLVMLFAQYSCAKGPFVEKGNSQARLEADKDYCDYSAFKTFTVGMIQAPVINLPGPVYPAEAKARNIAGRVAVKILINAKTGEVERACVVKGNDILGGAAKSAALRATFAPHWGNLVKQNEYLETTVTYNFEPH